MSKLLLAVWGNPRYWKEVTYKFGNKSQKSRTSLKLIQETIRPEKTIIIGLDTLAEDGNDYQKVKNNAEEKIKEYADKFGLKEYSIIISPGVGTFPNGIFKGKATDYYYYIFYKFSKIITEFIKHSKNEIDIHLDLTHGINYSTVLTYRAIKEVLSMISIFTKTSFTAYNTDPYITNNRNQTPNPSINIIEEYTPVPLPPIDKISSDNRPLKSNSLDPEENTKLYTEDLSILKEKNVKKEVSPRKLSAFIGSLHNGLPLALMYFYPDKNKLIKIISTILKVYEKYIEVNFRDKLEVNRKVMFDKDFKGYVIAYIIAEFLSNPKIMLSRKKEVSLDEIEKLNKTLFRFDKRLQLKINKDIYMLKNEIGEKDIDKWKIYNEIVGKTIGPPDKRNFLAHSGFEKNITEIKKVNGHIYLRYVKKHLKEIIKYSAEGLI